MKDYAKKIETLKYTVRFDPSVFFITWFDPSLLIDLENDEGRQILLKFNDKYTHVYIIEKKGEINTPIESSRLKHYSSRHEIEPLVASHKYGKSANFCCKYHELIEGIQLDTFASGVFFLTECIVCFM